MSIEKHIHFTYPSLEKLPQVYQENIAYIQRLNPDWKVRLYGDAEMIRFVRTEFSLKIANTFEKIDSRYGAAGGSRLP
jgi:mannosyltransferase OCH1-like enzyme